MKNEPKDNNPTREDLDSLQKSLNLDLKSLNLQNRKIILLLVGVLLAVFAVVIISKGGKQTSQPVTQTSTIPTQEKVETITLTKNGFVPETIKIKVGGRVIWLNRSGEGATVNSDPHPTHDLFLFLNGLGEFEDGSSVQTTIEAKGTYTYHNHFNPSQKGSIVAE